MDGSRLGSEAPVAEAPVDGRAQTATLAAKASAPLSEQVAKARARGAKSKAKARPGPRGSNVDSKDLGADSPGSKDLGADGPGSREAKEEGTAEGFGDSFPSVAEMEELLGGKPPVLMDLAGWVSQQVSLDRGYVEKALQLLQEGTSVHFIAFYRKELTGCMTEETLHFVEREMKRGLALEQRRRHMALELQRRGQLTPETQLHLLRAGTAEDLDDIWAPFQESLQGADHTGLRMGPEELQLLASLLEQSARDPDGDCMCESPAEVAARLLQLCQPEAQEANRESPSTPPRGEVEALRTSRAEETSLKRLEPHLSFESQDLSTPVKASKRRRIPAGTDGALLHVQPEDVLEEARKDSGAAELQNPLVQAVRLASG